VIPYSSKPSVQENVRLTHIYPASREGNLPRFRFIAVLTTYKFGFYSRVTPPTLREN